MTTIAEQIAAHFGSLPTLEPESVAVRYQGTETSWGQLGLVADGILECLAAAGVPEGSSIGWIARNDPALLGALIGLIKGGYTVSPVNPHQPVRSEEHTSELQSLMRISYAVFCLKNKKKL